MRCAHIALPRALGLGLMKVLFLESRADMKPFDERHEFPALASGMECATRAMVRASEDHVARDSLCVAAEAWSAIADAQWPAVCRRFVAGIYDVGAYVLIPSSRANRRCALNTAIRDRFPNAIEIEYGREVGVAFAGEGEEHVFRSVSLKGRPATVPKEIALIDDYIGTGHTIST